MKDINNNLDSDYREWYWRNINYNFFNCIFKWLEGLLRISKDFIFIMENGDYVIVFNVVVMKYLFVIVNIKKILGILFVLNKILYEYVNRDKVFL